MFKVHLPSDLLPENSPEARGRRFMDRVNQRRQMIEERNRQSEAQEKPSEGALDGDSAGPNLDDSPTDA
jgi:hypothetical protein